MYISMVDQGISGNFDARFKVRVLKTASVNDPESALDRRGGNKLVFKIHSPQMVRNLIFSIPHRLLVIGLRRGAIQGVETLQDLLDGPERKITWKQEFINKPVMQAGGPRGVSVRQDVPCASIAQTEYLALRALNAGYGSGVTFYWLRKGAARVWVRLFGEDSAREMMGHAPDSRTLEQYYVELHSSRDVTVAGLDENIQAHEASDITEQSELALSRLTPESLARTHGHVLNAQYRQMITADQSNHNFTTSRDLKNYERRMRRAALLVVMKAAKDELQARMTISEHQQRLLGLQDISDFKQKVEQHARETIQAADFVPDTEGVDYEQDFSKARTTRFSLECDRTR